MDNMSIVEMIERVEFIDSYNAQPTTMASKVWQDEAQWWMAEWRALAVAKLASYGYSL